jgi:hypothetical protein
MSKPYKKAKRSTIAFQVEDKEKKRVQHIILNTFHEDESQFMRYMLQRFLPVIEKEIEEEKQSDETQ